MSLEFREIKRNDLETIRTWRNSDDVKKYMYTTDYITESQQINWFEKIKNDDNAKYWIIEYNKEPVGLVSITNISRVFDSCSWAFYLGNTKHRGVGIGKNTELKVIDYVFNVLGLNKLRCEVLETNKKVIAMHEKFGFRREAYYRSHIKKEGVYIDVVGLGLLKEDWNVIKNNF